MLARVPADALDAPPHRRLRRRRLAQLVEQVEDRGTSRHVDVQTGLGQRCAPRIAVRIQRVLGHPPPAIEGSRLDDEPVEFGLCQKPLAETGRASWRERVYQYAYSWVGPVTS